MGKKSADNLLAAIERSKRPSLRRLLHGLGIRHVGEATARQLAAHFQALTAFYAATPEDFLAVRDVGPTMATALHDFFQSERNRARIDALLAVGVEPQAARGDRRGALQRQDGGAHRNAGRDDARRGQGGGGAPRRQGLGERLQEDRLGGGGRGSR